MQKKIGRGVYDTADATKLGSKTIGEFGQPDGYEEQLYITEKGKHFLYGVGGPNSPYPKENIKTITDEQADEWKRENI